MPNFNAPGAIVAPANMAPGPSLDNDNHQNNPGASHHRNPEKYFTTALGITPYDLAILEAHLVNNGWVPLTTAEFIIDSAVFTFRETYFNESYKDRFPRNERLDTLFDAYCNEEVYENQMEIFAQSSKDAVDTERERETAKYKAVRDLITDLALRSSTGARIAVPK